MASENLPMLPWFPSDFFSATKGWSLSERGLYRELLDHQWLNGALPKKKSELAEISGAKPSEFFSAWKRVRKKFVDDGHGGLINERLEAHRAKTLKRLAESSEHARKAGLASAAARRSTSVQPEFNPSSTRVNHPSPSPSPSEESDSSPDISSGFDTSQATQTKRSRAERGTKIADTFYLTASMQQWGRENTPHVDLKAATAEFVDFWRTVPGARGRKLNWELTWRNRMREQEGRAVTTRSRSSAESETRYDRMTRELSDDK